MCTREKEVKDKWLYDILLSDTSRFCPFSDRFLFRGLEEYLSSMLGCVFISCGRGDYLKLGLDAGNLLMFSIKFVQ